MQGSRNGVGMAIAWATMVSTGEDGYRKMARDVHGVHSKMKKAVNDVDGIELVCDSDLCIVPITSATLDVKSVAAAMGKRGWSLFASADPLPHGSIEVCVGTQHVQLIDQVRALHAEFALTTTNLHLASRSFSPGSLLGTNRPLTGFSAAHQWCADLVASVIEVTTAMTESTETPKNQIKPQRGVSAYDAVTETERGQAAAAADDAMQERMRRRLIAYVESSLELPSSAKL